MYNTIFFKKIVLCVFSHITIFLKKIVLWTDMCKTHFFKKLCCAFFLTYLSTTQFFPKTISDFRSYGSDYDLRKFGFSNRVVNTWNSLPTYVISSTVCIDWMRGAAKSVDVNRPAELQLPRSHSLEQPCVCSARRRSFTERVLAAAEGLFVWTVMHTTRRRCGVL